MKDEEKPEERKPAHGRPGGTYQSVRKPKLRTGAEQPEPPPLPALARADGGLEAEGGLRMLAALETMETLEPDFSEEDLAEEASVTIIEPAAGATGGEAAGRAQETQTTSLRARLDAFAPPLGIGADEPLDYIGPVEEATVEIVEAGEAPTTAAAPELPPRRNRTVAQRFLKALTGD